MTRTLPQAFVDMFRSYGVEHTDNILKALAESEPTVAIRANTLKNISLPPAFPPVAWHNPGGAYLAERPVFAADPAWHQGLYYVQDASSMAFTAIVREIVDRFFGTGALRYLDACAAPGGKTIAATEALPDGSLVVANEYERQRAAILMENTAKHGYPALVLTQGDAASIGKMSGCFDIVAVDAPCSGEGMFRKEPEAIRQWSPGLVESCASTQRAIIDGVWNALRPGGILIYSTCTFNAIEDEEIVQYIMDELGGKSIELGSLSSCQGVEKSYQKYQLHSYHFFPGLVRGEGLFVAVLRKGSDTSAKSLRSKVKTANIKIPQQVIDFAAKHIKDFDKYTVVATNPDSYSIIPSVHKEFCLALAGNLRTSRLGLPLGNAKGKQLQPEWQLAYSTALQSSSFPGLELDYDSAMRYLHGESLSDIPDGLPTGYATANYNNIPLGFIKNIGRRANNLLPDFLCLRIDPSKLSAPTTPLINKI